MQGAYRKEGFQEALKAGRGKKAAREGRLHHVYYQLVDTVGGAHFHQRIQGVSIKACFTTWISKAGAVWGQSAKSGPLLAFVNKVFLERSPNHMLLSLAAFLLQWKN